MERSKTKRTTAEIGSEIKGPQPAEETPGRRESRFVLPTEVQAKEVRTKTKEPAVMRDAGSNGKIIRNERVQSLPPICIANFASPTPNGGGFCLCQNGQSRSPQPSTRSEPRRT